MEQLYYNKIEKIGYVSIKLVFRFNDVEISSIDNGVPHLIEHMLFRHLGNKRIEELNELFARMGTEIYAKTTYEYISIEFSIANENFDYALEYISLLFSNQNWSIEELCDEKAVVFMEKEIKTGCASKRIKRLYDNVILNKRIIGTATAIKKITLKKIYDYYNDIINRDNALCFISGDYTDCQVKSLESIIKSDAFIESRSNINLLPDSLCKRKVHKYFEYVNDDISSFYIHFDIERKNLAEAKFIHWYLSGYTSPLSYELVDKKAFSYELISEIDEWREFSELIFVIDVKYDNLCAAVFSFSEKFKEIIANFNEEEYLKTVNYIKLAKLKEKNNPEKINDNEFESLYRNLPKSIPAYEEIKEAFKRIFRFNNYSCYCYYSCNRSELNDALNNLEEKLFK